MNKADANYLMDMRDFAFRIVHASEGVERAVYDADEILRAALRYWIQVIGEAAIHVSEETKKNAPDVDWHRIIGLRNRIAHQYLGLDEDILWTTITVSIPTLIEQLDTLLNAEE
jgi:uncharacterized protein with HEPN domain